jgi:class 3 adenylate cyclase
MTAALVCASCGTGLPPNAKFCNECGAAVATATTPAEYKQVTVLFADVVHSMGIAATVGAERLREIMAQLVDRATAVVKHFGGTVDKFTGDGIMAVFGAPLALEDHAVRACLAALGIQDETVRLGAEVKDRDGIDLRVRVGLNSGRVIAGEIGSGALGYTTIGEQVGMAQRLESVAPPGAVMLSASTARLVEGAADVGEPEMVRIKGAEQPVSVHRLLGMGEQHRGVGRAEAALVGRRWEMSAVEGLLDRAIDGHGAVVGVVGLPGIGKSRLVREVAALARRRGVEVFSVSCESHTSQVPFHAIARLLRVGFGVQGLDTQEARDGLRKRITEADPEDLLLLNDLLGINDPDVELPKIDPDARRRRLTALLNATSLARESPAVYVVEDAHWIDGVSESMLVDFSTVIPQTRSIVFITYRPEYEGALTRVHGAQTIALGPLTDPETTALISELLGGSPTVAGLLDTISARAAGNPFFAEEIVRELAERGVLVGETGAYVSTAKVAELSVPATLQATISARIDRLPPETKRTLSTAAVIGSRFNLDLLIQLGVEPAMDELVAGQFVDQVKFTRRPEYVFHHPLIRTVAYESQLKSDRAEWHRRLAAAIQQRDPHSLDENAAMIAEHLQAAGDMRAAYAWQMRAGGWGATRDIAAGAYLNWERARQIADALPADDPDRIAMRIAARALLCASAFRVHLDISGGLFEELRQLCAEADDKRSLTIGMTGLMREHLMHGRAGEASRLAAEIMALVEAIGDPALTVGLSFAPITIKLQMGEMTDALRWSQTVIDLADGDSTIGNFIIGAPLAVTRALRGIARISLGHPRWRADLDGAFAVLREADPLSHVIAMAYTYFPAITNGVLLADDTALRDIEEALRITQRSSDDYALGLARLAMGVVLVHRDSPAERERGMEELGQVRDMCLNGRLYLTLLASVNVATARERALRGYRDDALPELREATDDLFTAGQLGFCAAATGALVETLLERGAKGDVIEAQAAVDRLAAGPVEEGFVIPEIWLLRTRALLAGAQGDDPAYRDYHDRYHAMATSLGFEGHMQWAEAMP